MSVRWCDAGFRGRTVDRERARELRAKSWTLEEIGRELGAARSTVSLWVRDVEFEPKPPQRSQRDYRTPKLALRRQAQIDELLEEGRRRIGRLSERDS